MQRFEFKVIPAPKRGEKVRGVKTVEDRFAYALTQVMNELGAEGWDYVRADTLPCDERVGFTGSKTSYLNMLVFRRPVPEGAEFRPAAWLNHHDGPEAASPRLGPAEATVPGKAPAVGSAIPGQGDDQVRQALRTPQPFATKFKA
jgi:hypothetical protein